MPHRQDLAGSDLAVERHAREREVEKGSYSLGNDRPHLGVTLDEVGESCEQNAAHSPAV